MGADWRYLCKDCKIEIFLGRPARDELGSVDHHPVVLGLNREHCGHRTMVLGESWYYLDTDDEGNLVYDYDPKRPPIVWIEDYRSYRRGDWLWASLDEEDMQGHVAWDDDTPPTSD